MEIQAEWWWQNNGVAGIGESVMPIEVDSEIRVLDESEFHALAHSVMGVVFGVHNEFGRLMEEELYKRLICRHCESVEIVPARREVEIKVRYQDFVKSYFMDLLVACGLMIEAKTVETLNAAHRAQALHYLLLTGMQHGLLINLQSGKVQKEYVSTSLDLLERRRVVVEDSEWRQVNESSRQLKHLVLELLADWGAFLQLPLYREAIMHFFGGASVALQRIPVYDGGTVMETHEMCLITPDTGLALTALKDGRASMSSHLNRFLSHTRLEWMQWINLHNHDITFSTLSRKPE